MFVAVIFEILLFLTQDLIETAIIFKILSNISGLSKLADRYKTDLNPANLSLTGQTIQIGMVKFRRCADFQVDESGLFLQIKIPLWKTRKILIPWKDLKHTGYTKIYSEPAVSLIVGENNLATIAVPMQVFYVMKPFLKNME
jgi:hypothetical protein